MKRRWFNILSAMSLLLCVATIVLGILGIWVVTAWGHWGGERGDPSFAVESADGCIQVVYESQYFGGGTRVIGFEAFPNDESSIFRWNHLGFSLQIIDPSGEGWKELIIPDWFICTVTAVLPYLWYRSYRRNRLAARKGLCPKCGYDLRASIDRCPECGTPIIVTGGKA